MANFNFKLVGSVDRQARQFNSTHTQRLMSEPSQSECESLRTILPLGSTTTSRTDHFVEDLVNFHVRYPAFISDFASD